MTSTRRCSIPSLQPGCPLIVYGNMSGRAATFPWSAWTQSALIVRGFSLRQWMIDNKKKVPKMMETPASSAAALDKIVIQYTDYELSSEFEEALDHAREDDRCTKALLRVNDIGTTYDSADARALRVGAARAARVATQTHTPTRRHGHDASIQRYIFKYECLNFDNISKFLFRGILTHPRHGERVARRDAAAARRLVELLLHVRLDGAVGRRVGDAREHETVAHLVVIQERLVGLVNGTSLAYKTFVVSRSQSRTVSPQISRVTNVLTQSP